MAGEPITPHTTPETRRWLGWRIALPPLLHLLADFGGLLVYPQDVAARYTSIGVYLRDFLVVTAALYAISEGNFRAYFWLEKRLPWSAGPGRRFLVQAVIGWILTLVAGGTMLVIFRQPEMGAAGTEAAGGVLTLAFIATVVVLGVFLYQRLKASIAAAELLSRESVMAQNMALRQQVDPHFLFNSLNTIASLIPQDPAAAEQLVTALARVYRYVLMSREKTLTTLGEELAMVRDYAFAFSCRFGDGVQMSVNVPEDFCRKMIPPLTLQLLVENSFKHNVVSSHQPLRIGISVEDGRLVVRNNFQKKNTFQARPGMGLDNIRKRYHLLEAGEIHVREDSAEFVVSCPIIEP